MPFIELSSITPDMLLTKSYNIPIVILSIFIAILSSLTAFGILEQAASSPKRNQKILWKLFGASSMGLGIWAMHFIGMLALNLSVPVTYNITLTVLSIFPAIMACSVVFWMTNNKNSLHQLIIAGILLGSGIGSMHYLGMMAMQLNATMVHDTQLFYLSILIAVILATIALTLQDGAKDKDRLISKRQLLSATAMGFATSGMHYTAMSAVNFIPNLSPQEIVGVNPSTLILLISVVVFLVLLLALIAPRLATSIEERKLAEQKQQELFKENIFQRNALDEHAIVSITDVKGNITYANDLFCQISGYTKKELIGKNHRLLKTDTHSDLFFTNMWKTIARGHVWHGAIKNIAKDGSFYWVHSTIVPMMDSQGKPEQYISMRTDITKSKQLEEELKQMAHFDPLTRLPNRTLYIDRFKQALAHTDRTNSLLAICFLDLDNFKPINDNFGHEVGDKLLIEVANRINDTVRREDTVSRQGGDEFTLLLRDVESFDLCEQTLIRIRQALSKPYLIDNHRHKITASIGATIYPTDDADLDTLLRHADQAMYQAKLMGKDQQHLFNTLDDQKIIHQQAQLQEIKQALLEKQFKLYYQPKVNMRTGKVYGAEALIRWIHPERGIIPPLDFLPIIEGTDIEIQVGGWVINEAMTQLAHWKEQGLDFSVSINVSSHHLQSSVFFDQLNDALDSHPNIDSQDFQLEILESSVLGDLDIINGIIQSCQNVLGVTVALDDFGTGYSSLTHLRNLSASTIKIDQSFVRDMLEDADDLALIEGIISLSKTFNRNVIAEGVETAEHGVLLMRIGCDYAQGYGIAKPMPANEMIDWIGNYVPDESWSIWSGSEWEMSNLPLVIAQQDHIKWIQSIFTALEGNKLEISHDELTDHHQCRLGQWYDNHGQKHYGHLTAFRELEAIHEEVHKTGLHIIQLYQDGKKDEAVQQSKELLSLKNTVLDSLNRIATTSQLHQ